MKKNFYIVLFERGRFPEYYYTTFLLILLITAKAYSYYNIPDRYFFVKPVLTTGYEFGKNTGFTYGVKLSANWVAIDHNLLMFAINNGLQKNHISKKWKYYTGLEGGFAFAYISLGVDYDGKLKPRTTFTVGAIFVYLTYKLPLRENSQEIILEVNLFRLATTIIHGLIDYWKYRNNNTYNKNYKVH